MRQAISMNEDVYKSAFSSSLASTLCLLLAIPLVGMGVLWTISPLLSIIAGLGVLLIYINGIRVAIKTFSEINKYNM